ncbi:MAG: hypothetical protein NZ523_05010 [Elioraea sp.]|nr:hypothetical protein [Elioraea sp.]
MIVSGTNRKGADFFLGHVGLVAIPVTIVAETVRALLVRRRGQHLRRSSSLLYFVFRHWSCWPWLGSPRVWDDC